MNVVHQKITPDFNKYILDLKEEGWENFQPILHKFAAAKDIYPHCHPWSFTTTILKHGYAVRIFHIESGGKWWSDTKFYLPGQTYHIEAGTIHQILRLLGPFHEDENGIKVQEATWTLVLPGPGKDFNDWWEWKFDVTGIYRKRHYEQEFTKYEP